MGVRASGDRQVRSAFHGKPPSLLLSTQLPVDLTGLGVRGLPAGFLVLDAPIDLFSMHGELSWGFDSDLDLAARYSQHRDGHGITHVDGLAHFPA